MKTINVSNKSPLCSWLVGWIILFIPFHVLAASDTGTAIEFVDTRNYILTVSSIRGSPVPSVGTNFFAWHAAVTCSVAQAVVESGVNWRCSGWSGTGSIPASGASNTTGEHILTELVSAITWNWETSFAITNVVAVQRPGTKLVDITYDIISDVTNAAPIALSVVRGGTSVSATSLSGDIGTHVLPGAGKVIVWNAGANWNGKVDQLLFSVRHSVQTQLVCSGNGLVDSRNYALIVTSGHESPTPAVGTNFFAWHAAVTCSVAQAVVESGVNWRCSGWSGTGSIPASGASNTTGEHILTELVSAITWNWETSFAITNVVAVQRPGTKLVDITYDIISDVTNAVPITFSVEQNNTPLSTDGLSGSWGTNVLPGIGRAIVWNAGSNWNMNADTLSFYITHSSKTQFYSKVMAPVDTRNYSLSVSSERGTPVPPVGTYTNYSWGATVTASVAAIAGYTPDGWHGSGSAPNITATNKGIFTLTDLNSSISWNWTTNTYTVTFNAQGGTAPIPASRIVTYDSTYGELPSSTLELRHFVGWWMEASGGTQIFPTSTVSITENQMLYAHWINYTQTISGVVSANVEKPGKIRVAAMRASSYADLKTSNKIIYSTVATNGLFAIRSVPVLSNYWIMAFIDADTNGVWNPLEPIGSYAGNPIFLTNDYSGVDITLDYGDWDEDGINDDEEAFVLLSDPSNHWDPIWVDDDGPNDPLPGDPEISDPQENGLFGHPYDSIQKAINRATRGSVIVVMPGIYSGIGNKDIDTRGKKITIRSRYGYHSTTVDVASVHNGFLCRSNETAATVIQGFTIHTWASFFGRAGIVCDNASPTIEDCRIWDCGVAGILCTNGGNPIIRRTVIEANAGGVRCYGSSPVLDRCLVQSNYSERGAGVLVENNSHPYFVNTLIVDNRSTRDGGGVYIGAGCNPTGINCTIAFNVASNRGSAMTTAGTPLFKNVIVWGNDDPENDPIDLQSAASFTYSCVQEFHPGTGNMTNDPLFIAPGDYQLQLTSPCIDAGTSFGAPTNDYEGQARPMDGDGDGVAIVDMGAYEYQGVPVLLRPEVLFDSGFGVVSNRFGFNIHWNSGRVVVVDVNTNLNTTNWVPIATNTFTGDPWYFVDDQWTNFIGRFYRIRSIP